MLCKCITLACNWRLSLIQLLKFALVIFCTYGILLTMIPNMAECINLDCKWMPDSKSEMFIMLATSVIVILIYYNVYDEYRLSTKSDIMVLALIMIMASSLMEIKNVGIYSLVMMPLLYFYAKFSDINYHLLPPNERGDGDDSN